MEFNDFQAIRRRNRALQLRLNGYKYSEIATAILLEFDVTEYSSSNVRSDIDAAMRFEQEEYSGNIQALRTFEIHRLDNYLHSLQNQIAQGDINAINTALKIMDQRCKLHGLYPPQELKIRQGIVEGVSEQINLLFKAVHNDESLPDEFKTRIFELAASVGNSTELAQQN